MQKAGQGDYVVAEADESDGSFLHYHPWLGIVTNVEADHLENYGGDFNRLKAAYVQFMNQTREDGTAIVCADDENVISLLPEVSGKVITYGIKSKTADYIATDIVLGDRQVSYTMNHNGVVLGQIELSVPGQYNLYNSMAAVIACLKSGISFEKIAEAIVKFHGAKRRFKCSEKSMTFWSSMIMRITQLKFRRQSVLLRQRGNGLLPYSSLSGIHVRSSC